MEKLKNDVLEKVDELICLIKDRDDYKKYIELKKVINNNKNIMSLILDIKKCQKDIVNRQYRNEDITSLEEKIKSDLDELNSFPIYLEYSYLQEDLNNLFQSIRGILENYINKVIE